MSGPFALNGNAASRRQLSKPLPLIGEQDFLLCIIQARTGGKPCLLVGLIRLQDLGVAANNEIDGQRGF